MRMHYEKIEPLVNALLELKNQNLSVHSSLSNSREIGGHNRHFATALRFTFRVQHVGWAISGSQMMMLGDAAQFCFSTDNVARFDLHHEKGIEIIEHFEAQTERRTWLRALDL